MKLFLGSGLFKKLDIKTRAIMIKNFIKKGRLWEAKKEIKIKKEKKNEPRKKRGFITIRRRAM